MADAPPLLPGETLPTFKDRKGGLIFFGIIEILLGCLTVLMIGLMVFGQIMTAKMTQAPPSFQTIIPAALMYGTVGIILFILGIGSICARRWARALSLVLAWSWLATGIISMGYTAVFLPKMLRNMQMGGGAPGMPPQAVAVIIAIALAAVGILFILVPGILVLFYRSRHVKATCETRDPNPGWTDASPLPVIALTLWLGFGAACLLTMPLWANGVIPIFGKLLSGWYGSLVYVGLAAIWAYCAAAVYHLKPLGWWLTVLCLCLFSASAWVSFSRIDIFEMYRLMGYPETQIQMMEQLGIIDGQNFAYMTLLSAIPLLIYLVFVKRYFPQAAVS